MPRTYAVYILASRSRTLYVGVTSDLRRRVWEHRHGVKSGFASRYRMYQLVHFEETGDVLSAIRREKELKSWSRARKIALIEAANAGWLDLARDWFPAEAG
jgi:putative endonuclease